MTSVDADLRSGRRFEYGRRSESIIYNSRFPSLIVKDKLYDTES